jgi:hypothetical protein
MELSLYLDGLMTLRAWGFLGRRSLAKIQMMKAGVF